MKSFFHGKKELISIALAIFIIPIGVAMAQTSTTNSRFEPEQGQLMGNVRTNIDSSSSANGNIEFISNQNGSPGIFTDDFSNGMGNWTFSNWRVEMPGNANPSSSGTISNGRAVIVTADQNYGDAALRSARLYDIQNGGTFAFDVSLADGKAGFLIGWPQVMFVDQPVNAPSVYDHNGKGTGPRNGGYYAFAHTCDIPWQTGQARQFVNWVETLVPGETNCLNQVTITAGQLNRVELRYDGNGGWQLWASDAGTVTPLKQLRSFTMQVPEVGYFLLGSHNHASVKYAGLATSNATFDNISYPAATKTSVSYRNGQNVSRNADDTVAHISFNGYATNTGNNFSVTINGQVVPFNPVFRESQSFPASVEVPLSAINNGNNNITIQGFANTGNIDLVITKNIQ